MQGRERQKVFPVSRFLPAIPRWQWLHCEQEQMWKHREQVLKGVMGSYHWRPNLCHTKVILVKSYGHWCWYVCVLLQKLSCWQCCAGHGEAHLNSCVVIHNWLWVPSCWEVFTLFPPPATIQCIICIHVQTCSEYTTLTAELCLKNLIPLPDSQNCKL